MRSSISPRAVSTITGTSGLARRTEASTSRPARPGNPDHLNPLCARHPFPLDAVTCRPPRETIGLEAATDEVDDPRLVLDQEHPCVGHTDRKSTRLNSSH